MNRFLCIAICALAFAACGDSSPNGQDSNAGKLGITTLAELSGAYDLVNFIITDYPENHTTTGSDVATFNGSLWITPSGIMSQIVSIENHAELAESTVMVIDDETLYVVPHDPDVYCTGYDLAYATMDNRLTTTLETDESLDCYGEYTRKVLVWRKISGHVVF